MDQNNQQIFSIFKANGSVKAHQQSRCCARSANWCVALNNPGTPRRPGQHRRQTCHRTAQLGCVCSWIPSTTMEKYGPGTSRKVPLPGCTSLCCSHIHQGPAAAKAVRGYFVDTFPILFRLRCSSQMRDQARERLLPRLQPLLRSSCSPLTHGIPPPAPGDTGVPPAPPVTQSFAGSTSTPVSAPLLQS